MIEFIRLCVGLLAAAFRSRAALKAENLALRHQLGVYQRSVKRPKVRHADRACFHLFPLFGDLKPGDKATAHFQLSVDKAATQKEYGLDSEIRYRDALDATHISDTMKVKINVINRSGIGLIVSNPIIVTIIIAGVLGALYYIFFYRKRKTAQ